jgi:hypothetical protein
MKLPVKALLFSLVFALINVAHAVEIAGVKVDETVPSVANAPLKLNGAGVRYKFIIAKVYVAALYLPETKNNTADVLAEPGSKKINLTMLRDMTSDKLATAFMDGVKRSASVTERSKLTDQFLKFGQLFSTVPELKKGDMISMEWVPNSGTDMFLNGKKLGDTFPDIAFFNIILKIWLGDNPVDAALKEQLLGIAKDRH